MPYFAVIIATRNRPEQFRRALDSVLAQTCTDIEVIIVNDGSEPQHQAAYDAIIAAADPCRVRALSLIARPKGHGGSYARNAGTAAANAPYLCFLDDDDEWIDLDHLRRARAAIEDAAVPVDLYMTNQAAFLHGERQPGPIWLEDLPAVLDRSGNRPDRNGVYTVALDELLQSLGFCHLNTLIVRRALYQEIGGLDEANGWEHDRDLYLRLIDRSAVMKYAPSMIARHNIPDRATQASVTTAQSEFDKRLSQLRLLDRAIFSSRHAAVRAYARRHKGYTLKKMAELLAADGRYPEAAFYAREALGAAPTAKWAAYTAWSLVRALADRSSMMRNAER